MIIERKRFVFCQISNLLINPDAGQCNTLADQYYESLYTEKHDSGYYRPEHFWELPLWIGEMTHTLSDHHDVHLHIVTDHGQKLPEWSDNVPTFYCFSVLDVNKGLILDQLAYNHASYKYCFGGYTENAEFMRTAGELSEGGCRWYDSISDLCDMFDTPYTYGTNWSLFYGTECIPRITLSTGCLHQCRFCTVGNDVKAVSVNDVILQAISFKGLTFRLVYVNDKTFGQADNADVLEQIGDVIRLYNPLFAGFIIQTSVAMVLNKPADYWTKRGVVIMELGIESYNNGILKSYNKPQRTSCIDKAMAKLSDQNVEVIANIMLGLQGETIDTYQATLDFIMRHKFFALNIYTLAVYDGTALADDVVIESSDDSNELATNRSFWTDNERDNYRTFSPVFYAVGMSMVRS